MLTVVFQSDFVEGNGGASNEAMDIRTLPAYDDFEVLHPILYYIYTDRIYFTTGTAELMSPHHNVPPCNAEAAYRIAHLYGLVELGKKPLEFLLDTVDETNIIPQIFGEFALTYAAVGKSYEKIFCKFWNEIRATDEITGYFNELLAGDDEKRKRKVMKRYVALTIKMKLV